MIELIHHFRFRHSQFATVFLLNDKCCDLISHPYFRNRTLMLSCRAHLQFIVAIVRTATGAQSIFTEKLHYLE